MIIILPIPTIHHIESLLFFILNILTTLFQFIIYKMKQAFLLFALLFQIIVITLCYKMNLTSVLPQI